MGILRFLSLCREYFFLIFERCSAYSKTPHGSWCCFDNDWTNKARLENQRISYHEKKLPMGHAAAAKDIHPLDSYGEELPSKCKAVYFLPCLFSHFPFFPPAKVIPEVVRMSKLETFLPFYSALIKSFTLSVGAGRGRRLFSWNVLKSLRI